ncbi:MAG TPA: PAS domain S-box protein, partial [Vicinamibacterales bacterium]|nr:PAS domain S-box protein [Vicinamibacterales bacterium]
MAEQATQTIVNRPGKGARRAAFSHALGIAALAAAVLLRYLLDPWLGNALPLVTLFGAVAAAVWLGGGYRPAIVVAILGYIACDYLFIEPRGRFALGGFGDLIGLLAYLFTCSLIIGFGEATRIAQVRAAERREVLQVTLRSIGDAVITTNIEGRVTYLNAVAESLTGWMQRDAVGQPLDAVFRIVNEETRRPVENPATKAMRAGVVVGLANHTVLVRKDGGECPIDDSAAPIRDENGRVSGCVLIFRDVTMQRGLEQNKASQLETARLLASIIESSDDAIISKSLDGVIQSWNAAAERLFGYTAGQAIGRHISLVIPSDRIDEEDQIVASLKAGRRIEHFETERVRSDGRRVLVSLTISPIKDETGTVTGASKIVRDVTRQRQAEQRERQLLAETATANAKFHAFFEQGALFAGIMDVDGTILEANRLSWEACGYTKDQIIGKPFWQGPWWAPSPDLVTQIQAASAQAAAGQTFRVEMPYFVAGGGERTAVVTIQPIKDDAGRVLFLAPTGVDITDRKRAEADREKFVTLIENSTDFIGMCDLNGVPFFVNRAGLQMVGLEDIEQARQMPVSSFFFPEDQPRIMQEFFPSVLEHGHGEIEVRFRHFKTGEARWMAYKVLTLPDAGGRPIAFATVSQDVTERKRLEDNLRTLAADLSEADRRKNEFLAMLAHELRNPLAPISNAARALRLGGRDGEAHRPAAEMLERQVGQMARLVDDLLDMSRITRGKIELRKERIELAPIIHQAVEAVSALCKSMNHELTVTLPPQPVHLDADPARLAQIVGNLLNNASKFTDKGGHICLTVEPHGDQAVIRVRDNGIGIAAEQIPRLFDMFAQVDTSLERSRDGLGIGLTLVKTLVEMHGGTVEAHSDGLGRGSEFAVRLPIVAETATRLSPAAVREPIPAGGRRVLIVDDSEDGAESLAMLLQLDGHETYKAHDGLEAIKAAERLRPDAVLLDIGLPILNGYEVCSRIRKEPWGKELVLVALTGWGQEEDRQRSREVGFDAHMVKPVDHDALLRLLASLPRVRDAGS